MENTIDTELQSAKKNVKGCDKRRYASRRDRCSQN